MTATTSWGTIQGQEITFPMEVHAFNAATMGFTVPAGPARALLPGDAFEIVETSGMAQFIVSICDYRDNPWGDYNEVNLGFLARPAGAPAEVVGSFIYRMPVNQEFTCEAGNKVMGFPKVVTRIDAAYTDQRASFALWDNGSIELAVSVPRVAGSTDASRSESDSYSYLDGVAYSTPLAIDISSGVVSPADVEITIGNGTIGAELASLGLPMTPDFCLWSEGMSATFQLGTPL
ncbi:MAG: acetoacetate decarboxylase family protein [Acidimicrobiia bacterium]